MTYNILVCDNCHSYPPSYFHHVLREYCIGRKVSLGTNYWTITDERKVIIIGYGSLGWLWDYLDGTILSRCYKDEKEVV